MIRSSVSNTKNNLSALLKRVQEGEVVEITDRNQAVARIVPVEELDVTAHLQDMIQKGLLRPPLKPFDPSAIKTIELQSGRSANVVEALIEDREDRC